MAVLGIDIFIKKYGSTWGAQYGCKINFALLSCLSIMTDKVTWLLYPIVLCTRSVFGAAKIMSGVASGPGGHI